MPLGRTPEEQRRKRRRIGRRTGIGMLRRVGRGLTAAAAAAEAVELRVIIIIRARARRREKEGGKGG